MDYRIIFTARFTALTFAVLALSDASASTGLAQMTKLADQYQCSKSKDKDQVVDVLINGSAQRFQGIARSTAGKLVEVAGVVSDFYPSQITASNQNAFSGETVTKKNWDAFAVEIQLTNKLMVKKANDAGQPQPMFMMGGFGFGGGFGMTSMTDDAENDNEKNSGSKSNGPWGSSSGTPILGGGMMGGMGGMNATGTGIYPTMSYEVMKLTDGELAEIRKQALEVVEKREARAEKKRIAREQQAEHDRIFAAPPPPAAAVAPPRLGDQLAPRPGDVVMNTPRPGDLTALKLRPGDVIALQAKPGDAAAGAIRPGDIAAWTTRPGDLVGQAAGAVIGSANSLTFTALLDPKTGKVSQIVYREENRPGKAIQFSENLKGNDPLQGRITQFVDRIQKFATCCEHDSNPNCDQKFSPESQSALQSFRKETTEVMHETEPGGAIYSPFSGTSNSPTTAPKSRPTSR